MNFDKLKFMSKKYKIKEFRIKIGDTKKDHEVDASLIYKIIIEKKYDSHVFPYFEMTLSIPTEIYRKLKKHKTDLEAHLILQSATYKEAQSMSSLNASNKNEINETFKVILDNATPDLSSKQQKQVEKSSNKYGQLASITLLLYNKNYYNNFDQVINEVFQEVTLAQAVTYLFNKSKMKKVLFSPPSNYTKYKNFILPPIPMIDQLNRICNSYGMHKSGTVIFLDVDRAYVIERNYKCTAYKNGELKTTYIVADTDTQGSQSGGFAKITSEKANAVNIMNDSLSFNNNSDSMKKTFGENYVTVDSSNGKSDKTTRNNKNNKITNVVIRDGGDDTTNAVNSSLDENSKVLSASFSYASMEMFTPNKEFIIHLTGTAHKKYNGRYRISSMTCTLESEGVLLAPNITAEFKGK